MARRGHIGGRREGFQIDPSVFLQGGGGERKGDMELAMAMMGYGKGTSPQDQALEAQKQAWAEKYQAGQLSIEELKQKAAEAEYKSLAEARTAATSEAAQKRLDDLAKETQRQKEAAANLDYLKTAKQQETTEKLIGDLMQHGQMTIADPRIAPLLERTSPGFKADMQQVAAADREKKITEGLARYQQADPKARKALATTTELGPPDVVAEILKQAGVNVAQPGAAPAAGPTFSEAFGSKPWQEYQAPDLSKLLVPAPAPSGTEGIAPWLRPEAPSTGAMDWRYGGGGPSVDPGRYEKFPGSVEDLIAASGQPPVAEPAPMPVPAPPVPAPEGTGFLDELLRKIRGGGPPMPSQGVFQPFPG